MTDQWDAADRRQRTAHLGPLLALLPPALVNLVAVADRYVEACDIALGHDDFDRDTDAEYDALVAAVKRLRAEPMRSVVNPVNAQLLVACEAAQPCTTAFVDVYREGGTMLVFDKAATSLRTDAMAKVNAAVGEVRTR